MIRRTYGDIPIVIGGSIIQYNSSTGFPPLLKISAHDDAYQMLSLSSTWRHYYYWTHEENRQHDETVAANPAMPSSVSFWYLGGTRTKRVASGLKSGVSANRRNRFRMRWRRGRRLASPRPRLSRSASLSTSSAMSRVSRQSNSLTVHLRCSRTSSRSSTLRSGASRASYNSCACAVYTEQSGRNAIYLRNNRISNVWGLLIISWW